MRKTSVVLLIATCSLLNFAQAPKTSQQHKTTTVVFDEKNADWRTPAEISDYRTTPRYEETFAFIHRIAEAAPTQVKLETFGRTGEGRDLVAVIVSKDGVFDPAKLHEQKRPIVLIQNAIHAGEMDGKDACLALLRDILITRTKAALIDRAVLVILPIYNADGHERFGPYNRINQNGPEQMGWRTNAANLNLNRDYMKADAPETRAFLRLWNEWLPDFFVDNHVTDGADFQFDVTYNIDNGPDVNPVLADWITRSLKPYLKQSVDASGHLLSPYYLFFADDTDPGKGLLTTQDTPRFSTGYAVLQNRPGLLVELHMLKDYKTRVTGNYEMLRALLEVVNRDADKLVEANRAGDEATISTGRACWRSAPKSNTNIVFPTTTAASVASCRFPLRLEPSGQTEPFLYRGYKYTQEHSDISGDTWVQYSHEPMQITIPRQSELKVTTVVEIPRAYIVPAQWTQVTAVLEEHGLTLQRTTQPYEAEVEVYRCERPQWSPQSFEGRHLASWKSANPCKLARDKMSFPTGSVVVPMDQRAAKVAIHLLEPEGPDSLLAWGFFDSIFEQKEYGEAYVLEKLAREMIAKDPQLKAEFDQKVAADKEFAASSQARLNWFYKKSPWWDPQLGLYPVARLRTLDGIK